MTGSPFGDVYKTVLGDWADAAHMRNKKLKESTLVVLWYCQRKVLTTYVIQVRYSEYTNGGHSLTETNTDTVNIVSYSSVQYVSQEYDKDDGR